MHPFLFQIGGFKLPAYGLMVAAGYTAAILYLRFTRGAFSLTRDQEADLIFYPAAAGILGAKAVFAATYWTTFGPDTAARLSYVLRNFQYGFVFYGGLAAGAAAFFFYCRRKGLDPLRTADRFVPALPLAHGFGRIGCFLAGCCYGRPTGAGPLSVSFTDPMCEAASAYPGLPLHPVQLYEAAGNFLIFGALALMSRRSERPARGTALYAYILAYAALRFLTEFLRGDDRGGAWLGLSPAQTVSLLAAGAAFFMMARKRER
ncbi:MAG TPA: prolipoprotein diacylglyceryl transferase [Elusimicrobiales bacterium]|nr:prolipoprotein diacylglyceryl transferase [Elusimicrobiales bacterium]